jgi:sn-glycerol 3-phosphate transport system permease protein
VDTKRTTFPNRVLPYLLIAPQIAITIVFFVWPAAQAIASSFLRQDPFGMRSTFVGLFHYQRLFLDPLYLNSVGATAVFAVSVTVLSMGIALVLAVAVTRVLRGSDIYSTLLLWPYAVAPVVAGILWWFMFNSSTGILPFVLSQFGINWNHAINGQHAMILVILAATWNIIPYNFIFFLAGLQSVPASLNEAAAIDGAGPVKRFFTIVLPLLSPVTFFLFIMNINATMFDTFGLIDAMTQGGPAQATNILVYKVYADGFLGLNLGSSSAQSVVLMLFVIGLTFLQFRYVERRVQY